MTDIDKEQVMKRVLEAIESIRPHLVADSGDIEVVELTEEGVLKVRWMGTCETCSMNKMTMAGVEHIIKSRVPEIQGLEVS